MFKKVQVGLYYLLFVYLIISGLYFAAGFLIPLALAAVFAMLFAGWADWFEKRRIPGAVAALLCVLVFTAFISLIVFVLAWQLEQMHSDIAAIKDRFVTGIDRVRQWLSDTIGIDHERQEQLLKQRGEGAAPQVAGLAAILAGNLMGVLVDTLLTVVYMYLFLFYRGHLEKFILRLVPAQDERNAASVIGQSAKVAKHYLGGLAAMIVLLWIMYGIGFRIVGLEGAIFFAILCGTFEIVPFIGNLTGTAIAVLAALAQGGDGKLVLGVIVVYLAVQFLQTYILEPLVVGEQVNINALFTIMGLAAGELIWGVAGMVLAIPFLGIAKIICDHVPGLEAYGFLIGTRKKRKGLSGIFSRRKQAGSN